MIDEIHLHEVALIRDASLAPAAGLTVVTGESGSGKSALLSGIKLLVGDRGGADMVREGAERLTVEGRFFYQSSPESEGGLSAADSAAAGEDGLVVKRTVNAEGRSRVQVDGSLGSVRDLVNGPGAHVDLCGQHEHQRLLKASEQAAMLDVWAGPSAGQAAAAYRQAFVQFQEAERELERVCELSRADAERVENARFILRTIDAVDPREGEYEELLAEAERAENAEAIALGLNLAGCCLSDEGGALEQVASAAESLEGIARFDERCANLAQALREAGYVLEDAARDLSSMRDDDALSDPQVLEELQQRVASYQGLRRSYGPTMEEVFATREEAARMVAAVDSADQEIAEARKRLDQAEEQLQQAAAAFHAVRAEAAPQFGAQVEECLVELEMPEAGFAVTAELAERSDWTATAPDHVEFLFRPGTGLSFRPLRRIASGGEISRVMLAVKAVLGEADGVETLVFDEVDAGIGGKAALAVAGVLRRLAQSHQVICVTHLPQIAVAGQAHYRVRKESAGADGLPETALDFLSGEERVGEIARMLSGDDGATARAHAAEMLRQAQA